MDLVLVGLSGTGKSSLARELAARRGAALVDLDAAIVERSGRTIPDIFATDGEAAFRTLEARAVADLGPPGRAPELERVIAAGGGTPVEPRNRWRLYRGRRVAWLDTPERILARRVSGDGTARPLLQGDPEDRLRKLYADRRRFYAAGERVAGGGTLAAVLRELDRVAAAGRPDGNRLFDARTRLGRIVLGDGMAGAATTDVLRDVRARRVALLSEPTAWRLHGERLAAALIESGLAVEPILLPRGERAKRLAVADRALRELARRRLERRDPIVAVGGGALGDAAGFIAAIYLRGVPLIHVPTTLLAMLDSSIGGKTGVDLPEGKNLVGAFHQPIATVLDIAHLATLPPRQLRAALGEAVKMALLGDEPLLELLEAEGADIARGGTAAVESGALAEVVERAAWDKVEVVLADEREAAPAGRIRLNLGHSLGHAIEAAAAYRGILHGEAVAHGLRGALAIGEALGLTPVERADRGRSLLDRLGLARRPPVGLSADAVRTALLVDKKVAGGRLRWVLLSADGFVVRADVPERIVELGLAAALGGGTAPAGAGA